MNIFSSVNTLNSFNYPLLALGEPQHNPHYMNNGRNIKMVTVLPQI
jgi:hypothetical protein